MLHECAPQLLVIARHRLQVQHIQLCMTLLSLVQTGSTTAHQTYVMMARRFRRRGCLTTSHRLTLIAVMLPMSESGCSGSLVLLPTAMAAKAAVASPCLQVQQRVKPA